MCIVMGGMPDDRKSNDVEARRHGRGPRLRVLLGEARVARRRRPVRSYTQSRARVMLDEALVGPLPPVVDLDRYLSRICSLTQMAVPTVGTMMTAVAAEGMVARSARPLAVALVEMIYFLAADVPAGERLTLQVAIVRDGDSLILGLAAYGPFIAVPSLEPSRALQRGWAIVRALGAEFQRGICKERMVLGVTYRCPGRRARPDGTDDC